MAFEPATRNRRRSPWFIATARCRLKATTLGNGTLSRAMADQAEEAVADAKATYSETVERT
jgi:hypothetical protein